MAAKAEAELRRLPVRTYVVMSHNSAAEKQESARRHGAEVFLCSNRPENRESLAVEIQRKTGAVLVPPSDHPNIALGQGTAVLELLQQIKQLGENKPAALMVPSGGGGLLVGASIVCRSLGVTVFSSEPEAGGPALGQGRKLGRRVERVNTSTIADGLRVPVGKSNWELLRRPDCVKEVFTATEEQIREAMRLALVGLKVVVEPSAAVPLAVVLYNEKFHEHVAGDANLRSICIVLTGGNLSLEGILDLFKDD
jgi:threonine dehydratase